MMFLRGGFHEFIYGPMFAGKKILNVGGCMVNTVGANCAICIELLHVKNAQDLRDVNEKVILSRPEMLVTDPVDANPVCRLKCGHVYHHICLKEWAENGEGNYKQCPECKTDLSSGYIRQDSPVAQEPEGDPQVMAGTETQGRGCLYILCRLICIACSSVPSLSSGPVYRAGPRN